MKLHQICIKIVNPTPVLGSRVVLRGGTRPRLRRCKSNPCVPCRAVP